MSTALMDRATEGGVELQSLARHSSHDEALNDHEPSKSYVTEDGAAPESLLLPRKGRQNSLLSERSPLDFSLEEERAVVRKLDRKLTIFLALLYLLSFLDRSNIGNARIAGLTEDLSLSSDQYEWLLTAFYITYMLFEWMALLYRVIPPHIYITLCVACWGIVASLQSLAVSFQSLFALRAFLGICEAAFGPGVPFYLSFFFKQEELAMRVGLFISAAPLSTSFASSLAWVITKLAANGPIAPWRCLFLVEGFPSVVVAVFAWSVIPDSPSRAGFLSRRERDIARRRLETSGRKRLPKAQSQSGKLDWSEIFESFRDAKVFVAAAMLFCCNVAFSSLPVFLPTIVEEMGYDAILSQALSAPPYLFAFAVNLAMAYLSDRFQNRSTFVCLSAILAAGGYALMAFAGWLRLNVFWRYLGLYPATAGFFSLVTLIISWTINMHESHSKRGAATAILQYIGQCGPFLGTRLYPDSDKPYFVKGMSICCGFMILVAMLSFALHKYLERANLRLNEEAQRLLRVQSTDANAISTFRYLT